MRAFLPLLAAAVLPLFCQTRQAIPEHYYRTFSHTNPVFERIRPGEILSTRTLDSGGADYQGRQLGETGNPLTGPFYVEGAEAGDAIAVTLRRVRLNRKTGYSAYRLGLYSITPAHIESVYPNRYKMDLVRKGSEGLVPWDIDIDRGVVRLREPVSAKLKLEFPTHPMLGCIGVAAPGDFAPTSAPAGNYGGNLDYNQIAEGATVILPVFHPGALLYLGDGHAIMADGEPTGTGVETSMDVEFSVEILKNAGLSGPRVRTADELIALGAQPEFVSALDHALQMATTDMVRWITKEYGVEEWAAHQLIGAVGRYDVATVAGTVALRTPRKYLPVQ